VAASLALAGAAFVGGASFLTVAGGGVSIAVAICGLLGLALLGGGLRTYAKSAARRAREAARATSNDGPMPARATLRPPARGSAKAEVTLLAFVSPRGNSGRDAAVLLDSLALRYGDELRIISHDLPPDEPSMMLAEGALEALAQQGEPAWRAMREAWLDGPERVTAERVVQVGRDLGLDVKSLRRALADHRHRRTLDAARELARSLGVNHAPTFFIDGERLETTGKLSDFTSIVDRHLGRQVSATVREMTAQTLPKIAVTRVGLREIVVSWRDAAGATGRVVRSRRDALDRAQKVWERARMPDADFAKLARRFGDADGELGVRPLIDVPASIRLAAERLSTGEVSEVVEAEDGFHILLRYA